jgi:hypothetical protein
MLTILASIIVEESFGLIRAAKTLISCGLRAEDLHINTFRNTISIRIRALEKLGCITTVRGFTTAELRYIVDCSSSVKSVMRGLGFKTVPLESQRIVGYKVFKDYTIVVKKTSASNTFLITICNIKSFSTPLPTSACVYSIAKLEDVEKLKRLGEVLIELGKTFSELCKSTPS